MTALCSLAMMGRGTNRPLPQPCCHSLWDSVWKSNHCNWFNKSVPFISFSTPSPHLPQGTPERVFETKILERGSSTQDKGHAQSSKTRLHTWLHVLLPAVKQTRFLQKGTINEHKGVENQFPQSHLCWSTFCGPWVCLLLLLTQRKTSTFLDTCAACHYLVAQEHLHISCNKFLMLTKHL